MSYFNSEAQLPTLISKIKANSLDVAEIDLGYAQWLTEEHFEQLMEVLKKNTSVKKLNFSGTEIISSMKALAEMLKKNEVIETLGLTFCDLEDKHCVQLLEALTMRKKTIKLETMGNILSDSMTAKLEQAASTTGLGLPSSHLTSTASLSSLSVPTSSKTLHKSPRTSTNESSEHHPTQQTRSVTLGGLTSSFSKKLKVKSPEPKENLKLLKKAEILKRLAELENLVEQQQKIIDEIKTDKKSKSILSKKKKTINLKNLVVTQKIAETGGSGASIYSCLVDGWQCVMKELNLEGMRDVSIKQFETEIKLLEDLPYHPNIIRYLFYERKGNSLRLYVTRYSSSLRAVLSTRKELLKIGREDPFSPAQISKWAAEIINGLDFLHKHKIVHRDLKTDNVFVLLDAHNEIRQLAIGDFDTAKRLGKNQQAKTIIGTPNYMAPEVFNAKQEGVYGYEADIWSFGMVLYELVTLMQPYEDEPNQLNIPLLVVEGQRPKVPSEFHEEYKDLIELFEKCTQLDPEKRPPTTKIKNKLVKLQYS